MEDNKAGGGRQKGGGVMRKGGVCGGGRRVRWAIWGLTRRCCSEGASSFFYRVTKGGAPWFSLAHLLHLSVRGGVSVWSRSGV